MSKGELQKLSIARIFYKNTPISILDEPTSSLDPTSKNNFFSRLEEMSKEKFIVLITHKIEILKNSDKVLVLKKGNVSYVGKYACLQDSYKR